MYCISIFILGPRDILSSGLGKYSPEGITREHVHNHIQSLKMALLNWEGNRNPASIFPDLCPYLGLLVIFINYLNDEFGNTFVKFVNISRLSEVESTLKDKIITQCKISKMKFSTDKGEKIKCTSTSRE